MKLSCSVLALLVFQANAFGTAAFVLRSSPTLKSKSTTTLLFMSSTQNVSHPSSPRHDDEDDMAFFRNTNGPPAFPTAASSQEGRPSGWWEDMPSSQEKKRGFRPARSTVLEEHTYRQQQELERRMRDNGPDIVNAVANVSPAMQDLKYRQQREMERRNEYRKPEFVAQATVSTGTPAPENLKFKPEEQEAQIQNQQDSKQARQVLKLRQQREIEKRNEYRTPEFVAQATVATGHEKKKLKPEEQKDQKQQQQDSKDARQDLKYRQQREIERRNQYRTPEFVAQATVATGLEKKKLKPEEQKGQKQQQQDSKDARQELKYRQQREIERRNQYRTPEFVAQATVATGKSDEKEFQERRQIQQQREIERRIQYRKPEFVAQATVATPSLENMKLKPKEQEAQMQQQQDSKEARRDLKYRQQREIERRNQYRTPEFVAQATVETPSLENMKLKPEEQVAQIQQQQDSKEARQGVKYRQQREIERRNQYQTPEFVAQAPVATLHTAREHQKRNQQERVEKPTTSGTPNTVEELKYRQQQELKRRQQYQTPEFVLHATIATPEPQKLHATGKKKGDQETQRQDAEKASTSAGTPASPEFVSPIATLALEKLQTGRKDKRDQQTQRQDVEKASTTGTPASPEIVSEATPSNKETQKQRQQKHKPGNKKHATAVGSSGTTPEQQEPERRQQVPRLGSERAATTSTPNTTEGLKYRQQQELERRQEVQRLGFEQTATTGTPNTTEELKYRQQQELERRKQVQRLGFEDEPVVSVMAQHKYRQQRELQRRQQQTQRTSDMVEDLHLPSNSSDTQQRRQKMVELMQKPNQW